MQPKFKVGDKVRFTAERKEKFSHPDNIKHMHDVFTVLHIDPKRNYMYDIGHPTAENRWWKDSSLELAETRILDLNDFQEI